MPYSYEPPSYSALHFNLTESGYSAPSANNLQFELFPEDQTYEPPLQYAAPPYNSIPLFFLDTDAGYTPPGPAALAFELFDPSLIPSVMAATLPYFKAMLATDDINISSCEVSLECFEADSYDVQNIEASLEPFEAAIFGNAVCEVSLEPFESDDSILLRLDLGEVWSEQDLPMFDAFASHANLYGVSPFKITIGHAPFTTPLANFPVRIHLSDSCGIGGFSAENFFNILISADNRYKFSVTTSDQVTQCYVEIEPGYDFEAHELNLWVKVPFISHVQDTILYLFFDVNRTDNTAYVGETGSTAARQVWDSSFKAVYHMAQDPSVQVKDSTSNANHTDTVNSSGMDFENLVDGPVGNAFLSESGTDLRCPLSTSLNITGDLTAEAVVYQTVPQTNTRVVAKSGMYEDTYQFNMRAQPYAATGVDTGAYPVYEQGSPEGAYYETVISVPDSPENYFTSKAIAGQLNAFNYIASTVDTVSKILGITVNQSKETAPYTGTKSTATEAFSIGSRGGGHDYFLGIIDEIRISNVVRSDVWLNASRLSVFDQLLSLDYRDTTGTAPHIPWHYHHSAHVYDLSLPFFQARCLGSATVRVILPYFYAFLGFAGEINVALPYFEAQADSESESLASLLNRLPYFDSELSAMVEKIISGDCTLPRFQAFLEGTLSTPAAAEAQLACFLAFVTAGQSVSGGISAVIPLFSPHLQGASAKDFYKLRYRDRYWE